MAKHAFTKQELLDRDLPGWCRGGKVLADTIVDKSRWSIVREIIFRFDDQPEGEAYRAYYSVGATENQDERPWEYDKTIDADVVRQVERMVKVWEPIE